MSCKKEDSDRQSKRRRTLSAVMAVTIALSLFAGIVPAENGNLSTNAETAQNATGTVTDAYENASFEMVIPYSNERLKVPENGMMCRSHECGKDILIPTIAQNKNGLRLASLIKNATRNAQASRTVKIVEHVRNETGGENHGLKEKVATTSNRITTIGKSEPESEYKVPETYDFILTNHKIITSSTEGPSNNLAITILNETTASVEWRMCVPGHLAGHISDEVDRLGRNIEGVEKGVEDLFLQDVQDIEITEEPETLVVNFKLRGDYTTSFVTGKCRYTYELTTYAPIGLDVLKIKIPENKTLLSINPGPNEIEGNNLIYYDYNWIYPIQVHYGEKGVYRTSAATISEVWERPTPSVISIDTFGTNNHSRFCIPGNWTGWGSDPVPGTVYNASRVAEMYKPRLYNNADQCPDTIYYRVVKGYDPYVEFDAYLIQYFGYWRCQDPLDLLTSHEYDYEPIFIWVQNIGDRPYRVAYDRWRLDTLHMHEIHRTYLWTNSISEGNYLMPSDVYAQHKGYYPFGRSEYDQDFSIDFDISVWNLSTSLRNNWDGNHVRLGIANRYHTFDTDISGSYCGDYSLSPLTDEQLITWYRMAIDDENPCDFCDCDWGEFWSVMPFKYDISDPFYGLFWEDHYGFGKDCDFPTVSAAINSAMLTMVNGTLSVDTSAYYDNSRADGSSDMNLTGLWKDRFSAYLEGEGSKISLEEPFAANERSTGDYLLKFNNLPLGTYDLCVGVSDNINENNYWTEPENKITNEFKDDFEDTDFSLAVWSPTKGDWHIHTGSNNYLWTTSPAPDSYDPVTQMRGTSNWTDYTVEADIAFMDT